MLIQVYFPKEMVRAGCLGLHFYYLFHHSHFPQSSEPLNIFCMLGDKALKVIRKKPLYSNINVLPLRNYKRCGLMNICVEVFFVCLFCFSFQMLVIYMSGFFQGHIVIRAYGSSSCTRTLLMTLLCLSWSWKLQR